MKGKIHAENYGRWRCVRSPVVSQHLVTTTATAMIRTLALVCLLVPFIGAFEVGFKRRFDAVNLFNAFKDVPRSNASAAKDKWVNVERPYSAEGFEPLQMWCPADDYSFCILTDETSYAAGVQISVRVDAFTPVYDMDDLGFKNWEPEVNGETIAYYTKAEYFVAPDAETRINYPDPDKTIIRNDYVTVEGFKDQLVKIAKYVKDLDTVFTKQACFLWMGLHYYYNMSEELECSSTTMFTWFPLYDGGELNAIGFMVPGTLTVGRGQADNFEHPPKAAVKLIVPHGPECMYDDVGENGVTTMHVYFTEHPRRITCLFG
ncbi:hypothetical protein SFRURICE_003472 [Spodoptera frugiperda]|nr:hypothetical protein SFRURICE_003472 [Spodoptera frugiperda]